MIPLETDFPPLDGFERPSPMDCRKLRSHKKTAIGMPKNLHCHFAEKIFFYDKEFPPKKRKLKTLNLNTGQY